MTLMPLLLRLRSCLKAAAPAPPPSPIISPILLTTSFPRISQLLSWACVTPLSPPPFSLRTFPSPVNRPSNLPPSRIGLESPLSAAPSLTSSHAPRFSVASPQLLPPRTSSLSCREGLTSTSGILVHWSQISSSVQGSLSGSPHGEGLNLEISETHVRHFRRSSEHSEQSPRKGLQCAGTTKQERSGGFGSAVGREGGSSGVFGSAGARERGDGVSISGQGGKVGDNVLNSGQGRERRGSGGFGSAGARERGDSVSNSRQGGERGDSVSNVGQGGERGDSILNIGQGGDRGGPASPVGCSLGTPEVSSKGNTREAFVLPLRGSGSSSGSGINGGSGSSSVSGSSSARDSSSASGSSSTIGSSSGRGNGAELRSTERLKMKLPPNRSSAATGSGSSVVRPGHAGPAAPVPLGPRLNREITAPYVRLVLEEGHEVLSRAEALHRASEACLDLMEVNSRADPPVCRLVDYQRFLFSQRKKEKDLRQRQIEKRRLDDIKDIRISARMAQRDLEMKAAMVLKHLQRGHRVKCTLLYETGETRKGDQRLKDLLELVGEAGKMEIELRNEGHKFWCLLRPAPNAGSSKGSRLGLALPAAADPA